MVIPGAGAGRPSAWIYSEERLSRANHYLMKGPDLDGLEWAESKHFQLGSHDLDGREQMKKRES